MDIRKVKKLIELLESSGISEIEIKEGEESVRISRGQPTPVVTSHPITQNHLQPAHHYSPEPSAVEDTPEETQTNAHTITSPMVGTFYAAPSPTSDPFVTVGSTVKKGDTLCIVEAMKIMNPIEADVSGKIINIEKGNGESVEYGEVLFAIDPQ